MTVSEPTMRRALGCGARATQTGVVTVAVANPAGPSPAEAGPIPAEPRWSSRPGLGAGPGAGLAVLAVVVFSWHIEVPYPWNDEGATRTALMRSWDQLWVLAHGPDAPMLPYYLLVKAWTTALQTLWPALPTLVAMRLLSAIAAAGCVLALAVLVARHAGRLTGLVAGAMLIGLPGFDRYAQEARPYTLLACAATISWLLWDRWLRPTGHRTPGAAPRYTASLALVALVHTFGLFQWPGHLVATLTAPGSPRARLRRGLVLGAMLAVATVLAGAQLLASLRYGTGPTGVHAHRVVSPSRLAGQLLRGISFTPHLAASVLVLALALVGAAQAVRSPWRELARPLLIWLCVPLALELALGAVRTNLVRLRYWIAFLPPLAALAALGAMALAVGLGARLRRGTARETAAVALAAALLGLQLTVTLGSQLALRSPAGHGYDLAPVLADVAADRAAHPGLIPVIGDSRSAGIFAAAAPALQSGNPLERLDPAKARVYTSRVPVSVVQRRLAGPHTLLWIYRGTLRATDARAEMPRALAALHPRVEAVRPAGPGWTVLLLRTS